MNNIKCPFCNKTELEKGLELQSGGFILGCPKCKKSAIDIFWYELIKVRKELELAKDTLQWYDDNYDSVVAKETLAEINSIEKEGEHYV